MKFNIKVLVSIFCVVSSCVFTLLFLFINDTNLKNNETVTSLTNKNGVTLITNTSNKEDNSSKEIEEVIVKEETKNSDKKDNNSFNVDNKEDKNEERVIVYDNMTIEELSAKLDRSFKNELSGKGSLYASYSLEKGVDPYLAAAISLEETGCNFSCSNLVKSCNNVGGMIGSGCNGFSSWPTLDDGIRAFIDNIARNYVAYGLTTADTMNPKYAENPMWAHNVNNYINIIKNN